MMSTRTCPKSAQRSVKGNTCKGISSGSGTGGGGCGGEFIFIYEFILWHYGQFD